MEIKYKEFLISDNKSLIQVDKVWELLSTTYWAQGRKKEIVQKAIENSICFGIYLEDKQVGFARYVTDYATVYWLSDVIIDTTYRKLGLGKALVKAIVERKELQSLVGILATMDADGLYEKYGFQLSDERFMRKPKTTN